MTHMGDVFLMAYEDEITDYEVDAAQFVQKELRSEGIENEIVNYIANTATNLDDMKRAAKWARRVMFNRLKQEFEPEEGNNDRDELDPEKELRINAFRRALYEGLLEIGPTGVSIAGWDEGDPYEHTSFSVDPL